MRRKWTAAYAVLLVVGLLGGMLTVAVFAFAELQTLLLAFAGLLLAFLLAPACHELGHFVFAMACEMKTVYLKCFCFRYRFEKGNGKFTLCSPFLADETQVLPKTGKNMKKRALAYSLGGLSFSTLFLLVIGVVCILNGVSARPNFLLLGMLPYSAYLLLLNAVPFEYPSGKTDALVALGILRDEPAETAFVGVMELYGELYAGIEYGDLEEEKLNDLPQLAEDEPLYAAILDLKYRRALALEDYAVAEDCLKRLLASEEYLTDTAYQTLKIELVYFSLLLGEDGPLKKMQETDEKFLRSEDYLAKRILALYSARTGRKEQAEALIAQGNALLERERTAGVKALEKELLQRIKESL